MKSIWIVTCLFAFVLTGFTTSVQAETSAAWRITKTEWTSSDEKGFGDFVRKIAESGCTTTVECIKSPSNPYRDTDPPELNFRADCAKFVYMLRAYYAWKNGLPFGYVDYMAGVGEDLRFSRVSNTPISRRDLVDWGQGVSASAELKRLHDKVWTATFRTDPASGWSILSDFYSPKLAPGSIRPGTLIYDINGHVGIVYEVKKDGKVLYMDAHPDESVTRAVYGPQFGQSPQKLGGGFKNFRPLKLTDSTKQPDGTFVGGRIVVAANSEIADYGLEQYRGNVADSTADGPEAKFAHKDLVLDLFTFVETSMSDAQATTDDKPGI